MLPQSLLAILAATSWFGTTVFWLAYHHRVRALIVQNAKQAEAVRQRMTTVCEELLESNHSLLRWATERGDEEMMREVRLSLSRLEVGDFLGKVLMRAQREEEGHGRA